MTAENIIQTLDLQPHPEGGFFKETYRSKASFAATNTDFPSGRSHSTAIYFLLRGGEFSALHRIKSDEVWHFYHGSPLIVHTISPDGDYAALKVGHPQDGCQFQAVVPAGHWFGASLESTKPNDFALVGCTVAPGFDFQDFEMPTQHTLLQMFPQHEAIIKKITSPPKYYDEDVFGCG
ncbi:MAG: cupin domain-containing protein [Schleiferiaceae bacterium]|nr:cupin domain-containing protein [Schleiferiaceae bacterium]